MMRRFAYWASVLALLWSGLCALATPLGAAPNLFHNGGFEDWPAAGLPPGWSFVRGQSLSVFHKDAQQRQAGAASLRFDFAPPNNTGWIDQQIGGIHPDTEYRLSGFIKVALGAQVQLELNVEPNLGGRDLPQATEWTAWEWTFNAQEAASISPQFRFRGSGTVWLDSLQLEQVGEAGASILPERRGLLKLLEFQRHAVDPKTNTDRWTAPYRGRSDAEKVFPVSIAPAWPQWRVGQWARYLCHDDLLVPSDGREKRPVIALVDCAIVGQEKLDGKTYYWYQSVVRLDKYWVARSTGLYDSGEKILLATPRRIVLSLLVDGPQFQDVRRYQLQVDGGPLLEYTDGQRAVLPALNIDHALIRPLTAALPATGLHTGRELNGRVPITGLLKFEYHGPQLHRSAVLVNWGRDAADARRPGPPLAVRLGASPMFGVAFDGFGDLSHYREMAAVGVTLFQHMTMPYLGEAREFFNTVPAYFYAGRHWDVDVFDVCRSNFRGFTSILDEPYDRQRKMQEYVKLAEAATMADAARHYSTAIDAQLQRAVFWPGETLMDYDSPTGASWYSARAGAAGFVLENARLTQELEEVERATGKKKDSKEAQLLVDEVNIACLRGAARRFGTWWGQGLYRWTPERFWRDELVHYTERGASFVGFWIEGGAGQHDPELKFYHQVLHALPDLIKAVRAVRPQPRVARTALVVPDGYVLGLAGAEAARPWGLIDYPAGTKITHDVLVHAAELVDRAVPFDILVDDPASPPRSADYDQIVRVTGE